MMIMQVYLLKFHANFKNKLYETLVMSKRKPSFPLARPQL